MDTYLFKTVQIVIYPVIAFGQILCLGCPELVMIEKISKISDFGVFNAVMDSNNKVVIPID